MIGAAVGQDHEIGGQGSGEWLHQDMDLLFGTHSTRGVTDHPAHRIAGGHGLQPFSRLQGNVGDLLRRGIELIERSFHKGIDRDRVDGLGVFRPDLSPSLLVLNQL